MIPIALLLGGSLLFQAAWAQSTSSYAEPSVPTGVPIAGDYSGPLRPQVHFSPPKNFMNDPNGMFLDPDGLYHLYYQYNPTSTVAGNQHWGHATSRDLYHWTNQPIALFPSAPDEGIFSGSAVLDPNNTSSFFPNQTDGVVAIYTLNTPAAETQEIAYSRDGGYTFEKYAGNPVLDVGSKNFRDPKVIWHAPTQRWVMVVAYAQEFAIGIFTSANLREWEHASNFSHRGLLGLQYECPNLVPMPLLANSSLPQPELLAPANFVRDADMYLLLISINPGAPLGGSISQYFPGTFNGTHFVPVDGAARIADFGKDNYAGQFFSGVPEGAPQVSIAWASNWEYSQVVPTGEREGWRSAMTLPRWNVLARDAPRAGWSLISLPYGGLSSVGVGATGAAAPAPRDNDGTTIAPLASNPDLGNGSLLLDFSPLPSAALAFTCTLANIPTTQAPNTTVTGTLNFTLLSSATGESLRGGFFLGGDAPFFLDRSGIQGFGRQNPFFTDKVSVSSPIRAETGRWDVTVVVDRSLLEVFLDGGSRSATMSFFPEGGGLDTLLVKAGGLNEGVTVRVEVWGLESAWVGQGGGNGTVVGGNGTSGGIRGDGVGMGRRWDGWSGL